MLECDLNVFEVFGARIANAAVVTIRTGVTNVQCCKADLNPVMKWLIMLPCFDASGLAVLQR